MKKVLLLALLSFFALQIFPQTDGISYQAVIIGPGGQEIPGVDASGNILPNALVAIRFTIIDSNNFEEYQEIHYTNTDEYGRVNLMIGTIDPDSFELIKWDGTSKNLKVEIDFSGSGTSYVDMSRQELTFVPYAFHRNILARGTLIVDDITDLNSELRVGGPTNLNSTLSVNNGNTTDLSGPLNVTGQADFGADIQVGGVTSLNNDVNINNNAATYLSGDLTVGVDGVATFNGATAFNGESQFGQITVAGTSDLNGRLRVNANMDASGGEDTYNAYPLLVEGSKQGIAIKVTGSRSNSNNYVSFWDDDTGSMWGRIEGETTGDLWRNPEHILETTNKSVAVALATADLAIAGFEVLQGIVDVGASSSSATACVGFGACVTAPIPALIIASGTNLVLKIANAVIAAVNLGLVAAELIEYEIFIHDQIGVTYQSGSGDYAEWLPKLHPDEELLAGDIVGVTNGFVSKSTSGAQKVMVVSTRPIVLGNMPPEEDEHNYVKIAFMGQVPVKVLGKAEPGDYILPAIFGNGFGEAVHPENMTISDYSKVVGMAWSGSGENDLNFINTAVGLNANDLSSVVLNQDQKIKLLETKLAQLNQQQLKTNELLSDLVPGFGEAMKMIGAGTEKTMNAEPPVAKTDPLEADKSFNVIMDEKSDNMEEYYLTPVEQKIIYFQVSDEQLEASIELAREMYLESSGKSLEEHPFWKKMEEEPAYVLEVKDMMKTKLEKSINMQKSVQAKASEKSLSRMN